MTDKQRWPLLDASRLASSLVVPFLMSVNRMEIAGSIRRRKPMVGDIEILFIPKMVEKQVDLLMTRMEPATDEVIENLIKRGVLEKRKNVNGSEMFGPKNKLMRHVASGVPVDLFATDEASWFNYLVCRTGPAESNTRIASLAKARGWTWHPYKHGFSRGGVLTGEPEEWRWIHSEEEVFEFVGLPYLPPEKRA